MVIAAFVEFLNISAVVPLLTEIINKGQTDGVGNSQDIKGLMLPLVSTWKAPLLFFVCVTFLSGVFRIVILWVTTRLSYTLALDIAGRIYNGTLHKPLEEFATESSAGEVSLLTRKIDILGNQILLPFFIGLSHLILFGSVVFAVLSINQAAIYGFLVIGIAYYVVRMFTKQRLRKNSAVISKTTVATQSTLQESLIGIRHIRIQNLEETKIKNYSLYERENKRAQAENILISQAPKYIIETCAILAIVILASLPESDGSNNVASFLPGIGMLAFAGQRVFPIMQRIFWSITTLNGSSSVLDEILKAASRKVPTRSVNTLETREISRIEFCNVRYRYPSSRNDTLRDVNFNLKLGEKIAIIGRTGAGKSTLIDLMLGLVMPSQGVIKINDEELSIRNIQAWHRSVALVPQEIVLDDTTISAYIVDHPGSGYVVDNDKLIKVLKVAQLSEFINDDGSINNITVGERGSRLSGGQRQRVAIARALYKDAKYIFLDEPTSALDSQTEAALLESLIEYMENKTLIVITHNKSISNSFDRKITVQDKTLVVN